MSVLIGAVRGMFQAIGPFENAVRGMPCSRERRIDGPLSLQVVMYGSLVMRKKRGYAKPMDRLIAVTLRPSLAIRDSRRPVFFWGSSR